MARLKKDIISLTKNWEGGLSKDLSDSASSFPSPCTYKGQTGWHTNRGVTWRTFKELSSKLGYASDCKTFLEMPDDVWLKIFKNGFWDKFYLDDYNSQAIADTISQLAWASGNAGAYRQLAKFLNNNYNSDFDESINAFRSSSALKMKDKFNQITKLNEKGVYDKLYLHLENYYKSLNNPKYIKGWLKRLDELQDYTEDFVGKNKWFIVGGLFLIASGIIFLIYKKDKVTSYISKTI